MAKSGKKTYRAERRRRRPVGPLVLIASGGLLLVAILAFALVNRSATQSAPPPGFTPQAEGPRIAVDREVMDFGKRPLDIPVEAVFRVRNVGSAPLRIQGRPQVEVVEGC